MSKKRERAAEVRQFLGVASDLGLRASEPKDERMDGVVGGGWIKKFEVTAIVTDIVGAAQNERQADLAYAHPMVGAVLIEKAEFDPDASSVLVCRVPSAGLTCRLGLPTRISDHVIHVDVERENRADIVTHLVPDPNAVPENLERKKARTDQSLIKKYGAHINYQVGNYAFKTIVPKVETWTM